MKLENFISKLRGVVQEFEQEPAKFGTDTLEDGSTIQYDGDEILVGSAVYRVSEDGTTSPLEDGVYMLASGAQVSVSAGVVVDVVVPVVEVEDDKEEMKAQIAELTKKVEALTKLSSEMIAKFSAHEKTSSKIVEAFKALAAEEVEAPIITAPSKLEVKQSRIEKLSQTLKTI